MTLEDAVAEQAAELLLESAKARALTATANDERTAAELRDRASALESYAVKWEQRLRWWKLLRRREGEFKP